MAKTYGRMTVGKLKSELAKRGAVTSGRKEALVDRLEAYERNENFQPNIIVLPEYNVPNWPTSGFKQLVPQHRLILPKLDIGQIDGYFKYRVACDNDMVLDIKAVEKGQALLESDRVLACSVYVTTSDVYFSGLVLAAMKKRVSYNYKVRISGRNAEILNTHCECPAGKGPHGTCKHLAAVLLMLVQFISDGVIAVKKSCTESSQTFHVPSKKYEGSPVRCEDLPAKKRPCLEDPRPLSMRNRKGYADHVRNLVINFCANSGEDITMRYLYPKADIQAASLDHLYFPLPFTEYWVDGLFQITESEAISLEQKTRQQSGCREWHEARRWRLTASRFGEITKITSRRNKEKLCQNICDPPRLTCPAVIHGLKFESLCRRKFEVKTNLKVQQCGIFVRPEHGYLGASPDGVVDKDHIIEIKCPYAGRDMDIVPCKEFPYLEYVSNKIQLQRNSKYYCQVQGQLFLSKRKYCYFVVYTSKDLFIEKIEIDTAFCSNSLIPKLELFYIKYHRPFLAKTAF